MINRRTALAGAGALALSGAARPAFANKLAEHHDVIVIGAGLAGLYAARLLEQEGRKPVVFEASHRPGGRVITLDEVPGKPEAGLAVIGGMYARSLNLCHELGLELQKPVQMRKTEATRMLWIDGTPIMEEDWPTHPLNPFPDAYKSHKPDMALSQIMLEDDPFSSTSDWIRPEFHHLDIPTGDYLRSKGLSERAIRLIDIGSFTNRLENTSFLHYMRVWHWALAGGPRMFSEAKHIVGGMERLPETMAATLASEIRYDTPVLSISQQGDKVELLCADGSRHLADRVVNTVPLTVMRRMHFNGMLPARQQRAIDELPYVDAIQVYMVPTEPFWEKDGLPPGMWTDTVIESIRPLAHGPDGEVTNLIADLTGEGAWPYFLMSKKEVGEFILREMARMRPASAGKVKVHKVVNKSVERYARGDWPYWRAGQVSAFADVVSQPVGGMHFAGDWAAVDHRGCEGALESGERAALEILLA
ncbi:MAG: NAD(P)/FAD-dependent oxidoreductase [Pseudomonadota bacterium]